MTESRRSRIVRLHPRASMLAGALLAAVPLPAAAQPQQLPPVAIVQPVAPAIARAWRIDDDEFALDPAIRLGVLPNGMRYAIRRNATPEGAATVRMQVDIGSLGESEDERGLAHFVEHMAFNGSTRVPEGAMVPLLERLGLAFGADTNASTGFEETTYRLDLPRADDRRIDTALMLMRETAGELLFDPEAVDAERGVVIAEKIERENYQLENFRAGAQFLLPDARFAARLPIGVEEVLRTAPAARLKALWQRWYRPERITLVFVGDADPDAVEAKIRSYFGDWQASAPSPDEPPQGAVDPARGGLAGQFVHPALTETVSANTHVPWRDAPDSRAEALDALRERIGVDIVNRRLARLARLPDPPFQSASYGAGDVLEVARRTSLSVSTEDGKWQAGIAAAEQALRQALEHGFAAGEVAEQVAEFRARLRIAADGAATRSHGALAGSILAMARTGEVATAPQDDLALFDQAAPLITPDAVLETLRRRHPRLDSPLLWYNGKTPPAGGTDAVLAAWQGSRAVAVAPVAARPPAAFAYDDFGTPGRVVADSRIADIGIRTLAFANGVRLNLKPTPFEKGRVRVAVRIDGGDLLRTRENPLATTLMSAFTLGGLEAHDYDSLQSILAGRNVQAGLGASERGFGASVTTSPEDLPLQLRLLAAYVTAPGYRPEALARFRASLPGFYARLASTPQSALATEIGAIISDRDPRFTQPPIEAMQALDFEALRATVADRLAAGAIEIGIVGDIDEAAAIEAVAATFGALPPREPDFRPYDEARRRSFTRDTAQRSVAHDGPADQALLRLAWPTTDDGDLTEDMRLSLLAAVIRLEATDRLRERLGAAYSPSAGSITSDIYPGYGYLALTASTTPQQVETVREALLAIVRELASQPVDADLLARARAPLAERIALSRKDNGYWLALVDDAQSRAERLERHRQAEAVLAAITADDLLATARRWLDPARMLPVLVLPRAQLAAAQAPGGGAISSASGSR